MEAAQDGLAPKAVLVRLNLDERPKPENAQGGRWHVQSISSVLQIKAHLNHLYVQYTTESPRLAAKLVRSAGGGIPGRGAQTVGHHGVQRRTQFSGP